MQASQIPDAPIIPDDGAAPRELTVRDHAAIGVAPPDTSVIRLLGSGVTGPAFEGLRRLAHLTFITFSQTPRLELNHLSVIGNLPSLTRLRIHRCDGLPRLIRLVPFPLSLRTLELDSGPCGLNIAPDQPPGWSSHTALTSLCLAQANRIVFPDLDRLPEHILHLKLESPARGGGGGIKRKSPMTLSPHLESLEMKGAVGGGILKTCYLGAAVLRRGPDLSHLLALTRLVCQDCWIHPRDLHLPPNIDDAEFSKCVFDDPNEVIAGFRNSLGGTQWIPMDKLGRIGTVKLIACTGSINVNLGGEPDVHLRELTIMGSLTYIPSGGLSDSNFESFPTTLRSLTLSGARGVTERTIRKLPVTLENLVVIGLFDILPQRLRTLLPNSQVTMPAQGGAPPIFSQALRLALEDRVKGQPQAINTVINAVCRVQANMIVPGKPGGVYLFSGPSGVGKTELSQAMAQATDRPILILSMDNYVSEYAVTQLIGAPPALVGHEAGGQLTNFVQQHPNGIVVLDEIEKAHPKIITTFLGVFDRAELTDSQGLRASFENTIIVMTSNLGAQYIAALDWDGDPPGAIAQSKEVVTQLLREGISPEFVGRIQQIVPFQPLTPEVTNQIMRAYVLKYGADLKDGPNNLTVTISDAVWEPMLMLCQQNPALGLRPATHAFREQVGDAVIARALADGRIQAGDRIHLRRNAAFEIELSLVIDRS